MQQLPESYYRAVLTLAIEEFLNQKAIEHDYSNYHAAMAYAGSPIPKFDKEGTAFKNWVSYVWAYAYQVDQDVKAGRRAIPSLEELFAEFPKLVIEE